MKPLPVVLTFLFLLASAGAAPQAPSAHSELEREILQLDIAHAEVILRSDEAALKELMAPELTVNHPTNQIVNETQGILELIRSGVIRYSAFERYPEKIIVLDAMVVVMGHEKVVPAGNAPNAGKTVQRRYTNIWTERNGKWQLSIRHANNVCTEE